MYIIEKQGVYSHGVFWIGEDVDEGLCKLKNLCSKDSDNYHIWDLSKFSIQQDPRYDAEHTTILSISKICEKENKIVNPFNDYFKVHHADPKDKSKLSEVILSNKLEIILENRLIELFKESLKDIHDNKQPYSFKIGMD